MVSAACPITAMRTATSGAGDALPGLHRRAGREEWESVLGLLGSIAANCPGRRRGPAADQDGGRAGPDRRRLGPRRRLAMLASPTQTRNAVTGVTTRWGARMSRARWPKPWTTTRDAGGLADVQVRQAYARARGHRSGRLRGAAGWQQAMSAYAAMRPSSRGRRPPGRIRGDTAGSRRRGLGRGTAGRGRDRGFLPGCAAHGGVYAGGRLAEQDGAWPQAADLYDLVAGHRDALTRRAYVSGRAAEDAGRWRAAIEATDRSSRAPATRTPPPPRGARGWNGCRGPAVDGRAGHGGARGRSRGAARPELPLLGPAGGRCHRRIIGRRGKERRVRADAARPDDLAGKSLVGPAADPGQADAAGRAAVPAD